ncbi:MAG: hypothetical protein H5T50_09220 [Nitrososphaeria archaeon]|nr:hypothetical protein [Nitrososphaeria archaeon]
MKTVGLLSNLNEYVDNKILYSAYRNAVDFLITEDKEILNKSLKLNIKDKVLSIDEALELFNDYAPKNPYAPPSIKAEYVYNLNIKDHFFDSLKKEYPNFEKWFEKISREGRRCLVYFLNDNKIGALLIYKIEEEAINSIPPLPKEKRLKLCTFKVEHEGYKIGELFIKWSVHFCVKNKIYEIYLTHFTKENDKLVELISRYGFTRKASFQGGEDIYVKRLIPEDKTKLNLNPIQIASTYYPTFYDGLDVKKFIIPILPKYHDRLFTDFFLRQSEIPEFTGDLIIEGNTIKKAYLCHSKVKNINPGDIIIFYRSKDLKALTSLGTVEKAYYEQNNINKIMQLIEKRTVYTIKEVEKMSKKPLTIILFNFHFHLSNPINLETMRKMRILSTAPRTIYKISHKKYLLIKSKCGIDARYTINQT